RDLHSFPTRRSSDLVRLRRLLARHLPTSQHPKTTLGYVHAIHDAHPHQGPSRLISLLLLITNLLNPVRPMHSHPRLPFIEIVMQIYSLEISVPEMLDMQLQT